jgi:hypothetical protein
VQFDQSTRDLASHYWVFDGRHYEAVLEFAHTAGLNNMAGCKMPEIVSVNKHSLASVDHKAARLVEHRQM